MFTGDFLFHQERVQGKWINIKHYHESLSVTLFYLMVFFFLIENKKYEIQFTGNKKEWYLKVLCFNGVTYAALCSVHKPATCTCLKGMRKSQAGIWIWRTKWVLQTCSLNKRPRKGSCSWFGSSTLYTHTLHSSSGVLQPQVLLLGFSPAGCRATGSRRGCSFCFLGLSLQSIAQWGREAPVSSPEDTDIQRCHHGY